VPGGFLRLRGARLLALELAQAMDHD
jgi:hypothetical protein